ncbi:MAG: hypothetical protein C0489_02845 [Candidatus Accumulibacter sp.]|nr:hypothetical protein [Accumulibacter sp.]MBA4093003.1 hypothetical protein [Accumulibacter sp.]
MKLPFPDESSTLSRLDRSPANRAEARFNEGCERLAAGDEAGAEAAFRSALAIDPDCAEAHGNLGFVLEARGALEEAEACYRRSLALDPALPDIQINLAMLLAGRRRFAEAEAACREAIALAPEWPHVWTDTGILYACLKREAEAEACYRKALMLDAGNAGARFNLSYLLLRQGRFAEGWQCLEARNWYAGLAGRLNCPRWQGEALAGKALLVCPEAGHGDLIQFCRYVSLLKARGAARITLWCHPALKRLFATLDGVDAVVGFDEEVSGAHDFWVPALSLPYRFGTRLETIPANIPYLRAAPDDVARWAARPARHDSSAGSAPLRVGLIWKGNPRFENDADRSLPGLHVLAPLGEVAGVQFVSLQKGAGEDEALAPPARLPLVHLGGQIEDFADTAAIVAGLDLVISVDTAVAHLAGALGKACWIMLPDYRTDWRWLTGRSDSPWYPDTVRLFRQTTAGDWAPVVAEIAAALAAWAASAERRAPS